MPDRVVSEISGVLLLFPSLSREGVFLLIRVIPLRSVHFSTQLRLALSLSLSWRLALGVVADTRGACLLMDTNSVDCAVGLCSLCFAVFDVEYSASVCITCFHSCKWTFHASQDQLSGRAGQSLRIVVLVDWLTACALNMNFVQ